MPLAMQGHAVKATPDESMDRWSGEPVWSRLHGRLPAPTVGIVREEMRIAYPAGPFSTTTPEVAMSEEERILTMPGVIEGFEYTDGLIEEWKRSL